MPNTKSQISENQSKTTRARNANISYLSLIGIFVATVGLFIAQMLSVEHRLTHLEDTINSNFPKENNIGAYHFTTYPISDTTSAGKVLIQADIDLLSEDLRWACASSSIILKDSKVQDLGKIITSYRENVELKDAVGIVCIGTASSEGDVQGQEGLAQRRVETLINIVNTNLKATKVLPVYGFNFGKFIGNDTNVPCSNITQDERRIVLIKIIKRSGDFSNADLEDFLKRKLVTIATDPRMLFPIDIRQYSRFNEGLAMLSYGRQNN